MITSWDGHKPMTSGVLLDLITTAHTGKTRFSKSQCAFFIACEFWAAAQNRTLADHLDEAIESRLRLAVDAPAPVERNVKDIEEALSAIDDPVDRVIELFAERELSAG